MDGSRNMIWYNPTTIGVTFHRNQHESTNDGSTFLSQPHSSWPLYENHPVWDHSWADFPSHFWNLTMKNHPILGPRGRSSSVLPVTFNPFCEQFTMHCRYFDIYSAHKTYCLYILDMCIYIYIVCGRPNKQSPILVYWDHGPPFGMMQKPPADFSVLIVPYGICEDGDGPNAPGQRGNFRVSKTFVFKIILHLLSPWTIHLRLSGLQPKTIHKITVKCR